MSSLSLAAAWRQLRGRRALRRTLQEFTHADRGSRAEKAQAFLHMGFRLPPLKEWPSCCHRCCCTDTDTLITATCDNCTLTDYMCDTACQNVRNTCSPLPFTQPCQTLYSTLLVFNCTIERGCILYMPLLFPSLNLIASSRLAQPGSTDPLRSAGVSLVSKRSTARSQHSRHRVAASEGRAQCQHPERQEWSVRRTNK